MNLRTLIKLSFLALFIQPCASICNLFPDPCCPECCSGRVSAVQKGHCQFQCDIPCSPQCIECINSLLSDDHCCMKRGADGSNCIDKDC